VYVERGKVVLLSAASGDSSIPHTVLRSLRNCLSMICFFLSMILALCYAYSPVQCFSVNAPTSSINKHIDINRIKSIITNYDNVDATVIPLEKILEINGSNEDDKINITYTTDFGSEEISTFTYTQFTKERHLDCINLFVGYDTNIIRCSAIDTSSINVRWNASWIPAGSTWLYTLADMANWDITRRVPDYTKISKFSGYKAVFVLFSQAVKTGCITLPISLVEGNTILSIKDDDTVSISIKESIDLVSEADKCRIQNRRVAQELAEWLDVSRRPSSKDYDEWASIVRQRVLANVPGAGPLDVDPNEDDTEGVIVLAFSAFCVAMLGITFQYVLDMP